MEDYEAKGFHWTYIIIGLIFPLLCIMWVSSSIGSKDSTNSFKRFVGSCFNHHTCSFKGDKVSDGGAFGPEWSVYKCLNKNCNVCGRDK